MDTLSISKSEIKFMLVLSSIVPVVCFCLGFYFAGGEPTSYPANLTQKNAAMPNQVETPSQAETVSLNRQIPDTSTQQLLVVTENTLTSEPLVSENKRVDEKRYVLQAGLFAEVKNAQKFLDLLAQKQLDAQISNGQRDGHAVFRVIVGRYSSKEEAQAFRHIIEQTHAVKLYLSQITADEEGRLVATL